jgi:NADPH:quinone reductase-like Zn-dependent oxidoreductase
VLRQPVNPVEISGTKKMKAVTFNRYGNYEQLGLSENLNQPEPKPHEVLVRVSASSINRGDWHYVHGTPFPLRFMAGGLCTPRKNIPGGDAVGYVSAVGADVTHFKPGDRVMADVSSSGFGGWAEYVTCNADHVAVCPQGLTNEHASTIPVAGVTALQGLRDHAKLKAGETVLINGATGGVGMFAALIARALGAEVSVAGSSSKADWLDQLGADHVIHYDKNDILESGNRYDVIADAAAYRPFYKMTDAMKEDGRYLMVGGSMSNFARITLLGRLLSMKSDRKYISFLQAASPGDMQQISDWIVDGTINPPEPRVFEMGHAGEAMRLMESREITGKVCLKISG